MKMKVARILAMIGAGVLCVFIGKFTLQNYLLIGLVGGAVAVMVNGLFADD